MYIIHSNIGLLLLSEAGTIRPGKGGLTSMTRQSGKISIPFRRRSVTLSPTRVIALTFLAIILCGTLLLTLPVASRTGQSHGVRTALFTATSATCVTGLVLGDTWSQWSGFGQAVILCMIELGGLGFMSAASLVLFLLRRKVGLRQRMVIAQALSLNDMAGVVRLQKLVLVGSVSIQAAGALVLAIRFFPVYGLSRAVRWGIFHAVSAFCNAGFDILGCLTPGQSVMGFATDPVVMITLMVLIVVGGLGFFVWEELARFPKSRRLTVYTRLVLLTSLVLVVAGAGLICLLEWNNPHTLGQMTVPQKILAGTFQSVSTRTAGFAGLDQGRLTEAGKAVTIALMAVGGSSGSTAGGIKTVTLVVVLLFLWSRARGRGSVCVFRRTIPDGQVMNAMTLVLIFVALSLFGGIFVSATSPVGFTDGLYESVSALATVGLSSAGTVNLSIPAQLLMIVYMYFGRVGVLTISLGFLMGNRADERYRYAQTNLLIG